jgi:hypothetical protein
MVMFASVAVAHQGTPVKVPHGKKPKIDGKLDTNEWTDAVSVTMVRKCKLDFLKGKYKLNHACHCHLKGYAYFKDANNSLYIAIRFLSKYSMLNVDYVIVFDIDHDGSSGLQNDDKKFMLSYSSNSGKWTVSEWKVVGGKWQKITPTGWLAKGTHKPKSGSSEFEIPFKKIGITPGTSKTVGFAAIVDMGTSTLKWPVDKTLDTVPSSWGDLKGDPWIPEFSTIIIAVVALPIIMYAIRRRL